MSGTQSCDALVIGAGVDGLAAAAVLARAGLSVIVAEAETRPGGLCGFEPSGEGHSRLLGAHALFALDPKLVKDLKLAKHGLKFAVRDMPLVGLRPDGRHLILTRDVHETTRSLAGHSKTDAAAWPRVRRELFALARALRPYWWGTDGAKALACAHDRLESFRRVGAAAWLERNFESSALKTVLAFDSASGGLSPLEPGSALTLVWRAAQEMCGLQGAVAVPLGGPGAFVAAFAAAATAAGAEIRTHARVERILLSDRAVAGVCLASGETIAAPRVLSTLSRHRTLCALLPDAAAGIAGTAALDRAVAKTAAARVVLTLDTPPAFKGVAPPHHGRFILAERLESHCTAHAAARAGRLPDEIPAEITLPAAPDPVPKGQYFLSALLRPVPLHPPEGWKALKPRLTEKLLSQLGRHAPDLARHAVAADILTPEDGFSRNGYDDAFSGVPNMLASWEERIRTPIGGLLLCGASAEPVAAVSGRAGRIAAELAIGERKR